MRFIALLLACLLLPALAEAACFADYKAKKQEGPLRLHYGVVRLGDGACPGRNQAASAIQGRIAADGWALLSVVSLFEDEGELEARRGEAGEYFLRY